MRKKLSDMIGVFILIIIIVISAAGVSNLLENKESDYRYASFFTEKQSVDVILIGSSHIRYGIFPMELWKTRGISAYNLAANGATIPCSYWALVNALDYRVPEAVVMDVFDMWPGRIVSDRCGQVHEQFDAFPLSVHKAQMILDLFKDPSLTDRYGNNLYEKRWELFWNLGEYHSRWSSLEKDDFAGERAISESSRVWKGAMPLDRVVDRKEQVYKETDAASDSTGGTGTDSQAGKALVYDEQSKVYLEKIIKLCKDRDIRLILINTGYDCSDEAKLFHDSVGGIADSYGVPYYDFTNEDIINFDTDLNSTGHNTHVNFSGAQKMTERVGNILEENCKLQDHREDAEYEKWRSDCEAYIADKHKYLREQEDLENYLMFLYDDDYQIMFDVRDPSVLEEEKVRKLIENLGNRVESFEAHAEEWDWDAEEKTDDSQKLIIGVYSRHDGQLVDVRGF